MTALDTWLKQATSQLAKESADQVRAEIQDHYQSARELAMDRGVMSRNVMGRGVTDEEADRAALNALGDAKTANRQYRRVLLTCAEARVLRNNFAPRAARAAKWSAAAAIAGAAALYLFGQREAAGCVLTAAIAMSPWLVAKRMAVNTPARGRIFRGVRWIAITLPFFLIMGPLAPNWCWLLISGLIPFAAFEWTRARIRRKLPVSAWPKHLYL